MTGGPSSILPREANKLISQIEIAESRSRRSWAASLILARMEDDS